MAVKKKTETYRIYYAEGALIRLKIRDKDGARIGTLTIDPYAHNALGWLRKHKKGTSSTKTRTLLNLVEWMES
jgi:hypothetical protein